MRARRLAGAVSSLALLAAAGGAGAATSIHSDTGAGAALGTKVTAAGAVYTIDGGTLVGANLFHSFSDFSLALGDTARWTYTAGNAAGIANVINRVTGGAPSLISGTLDSTALPKAEFWFINPAGIVFGAGAVVNVPGAAHFASASQLAFKDGALFKAATPGGSTLSMSPVAAFGFLGGEGGVSLNGVTAAFAAPPERLTFVGASVTVTDSTLNAGHLDLAAVGVTAANVDAATLKAAAPLTGSLSISGSALSATSSATGDGGVRLAGGATQISGSTLRTVAGPTTAPGDVAIDAGTLTLQAARIDTSSQAGSTLAAGSIRIASSGLTTLGSNAFVSADTNGSGAGGEVDIRAGALTLNGGRVTSSTSADGQAGSVTATVAGALSIAGGGAIQSAQTSASGRGNAGDVTVSAGSLTLGRGNISSQTAGSGAAGSVRVTSSGAVILGAGKAGDSSSISASSNGAGQAGDVTVDARSIDLKVSGADISSAARGAGAGGSVTLDVGDLTLTGGDISAVTKGPDNSSVLASGTGGHIQITASGAVSVKGGQIIAASKQSTGDAGYIRIDAGSLSLGPGAITSSTSGAGRAGGVTINLTGDLIITSGGAITSSQTSATGTGDAGDVTVGAADVTIGWGNISSQTSGPGAAGAVSVTASGKVTLGGGTKSASITASTQGSGHAGDVTVDAASVTVKPFGDISSASRGAGAGGNVTLSVGDLTVAGGDMSAVTKKADNSGVLASGTGGHIQVTATGTVRLNGGQIIAASKQSTGDAGYILIDTRDLIISRGFITSQTTGTGAAGAVTVNATGVVQIGGGGAITSSQTSASGTGHAGNVTVGAADVTIDAGNISSQTSGPGAAGAVSVTASGAVTLGGAGKSASITASTQGAGHAGDVTVDADSVTIKPFGDISSASRGVGMGGNVMLGVGDLAIAGGDISATTDSFDGRTPARGDAGHIQVTASRSVTIGSGQIIAASKFSTGSAGYIRIDTGDLTMSGGRITTQTQGPGAAGGVTVNASGDVSVSGRGLITSLTTGSGPAGSVTVAATGGDVRLADGGRITSSTTSTGQAGVVTVDAAGLDITSASGAPTGIETDSSTATAAGAIVVDAADITITGSGAHISSRNTGPDGGNAGAIAITTDPITLSEGGSITTDSATGAAGGITLTFLNHGALFLEGTDTISLITTSSAVKTAGLIDIEGAGPIVLDGGEIRALAPYQGAFVTIDGGPLILSTDRPNSIDVAGTLVLNTQLADVSGAVTVADLSFIDASRVLRGQCAAQTATGETSKLTTRLSGPFQPASRPAAGAAAPAPVAWLSIPEASCAPGI